MAHTELSREEHAAAMADYVTERAEAAAAFGCRGPVRYDANGHLHPEILQGFETHGFYIFENLIAADEVSWSGLPRACSNHRVTSSPLLHN